MLDNIWNAFWVGGLLCAIAQLLIDKTNITPARIMVIYVCAGAFLTLVGLYQPVVKLAGAGATIPIMGFGYTIAKGTINAVAKYGIWGIFTGGISAASAGICAAIVFAYIAALLSKPKAK